MSNRALKKNSARETPQAIRLESVRVHNLKSISLELPLQKLIVISGVSGSGKSSLAFDTLFAEGQRRYIECFSPYARQFLDRLQKPDADRIDHIPPAISLKQNSVGGGGKSTVATATEIHDYLRLLFARVGSVVCPGCGRGVKSDSPDETVRIIERFLGGTRFQICFPVAPDHLQTTGADLMALLKEEGFVRVVVDGRTIDLRDESAFLRQQETERWVIVDRLQAGKIASQRIVDSLEIAFRQGDDRCIVLEADEQSADADRFEITAVDGRGWIVHRFNRRLVCEPCRREFDTPEPRLFSFHSPMGACRECHGFGAVPTISFMRLVPNASKSLQDGAITAWTTPAYRHELDELLELADDYGLPVDVPFSELRPHHLRLITEGVPERNFGGLRGFFRWLERHRYKLSVRVFLNRWRAYETCPACQSSRLQPGALAVRVGGLNIDEICRMPIGETIDFCDRLQQSLPTGAQELANTLMPEVRARLRYLRNVGLEYLTLDRPVRTLSGGEARRVALTAALGSSLVRTLYVFDEPSAGLHPRDNDQVIAAVKRLCAVGNTVVVVEHDEAFLRAADEIIDIGPGAGRDGGHVVFQGPPAEIGAVEQSVTGAYLSGKRKIAIPPSDERRNPDSGRIRLEGARHRNLDNLTVSFPLGLLCVVTGVSGSGKSTLIRETLYPAICRQLAQQCAIPEPGALDHLHGTEQIDDVVLVDPDPVGRTRRSNPVTFLKVFDEIRQVFTETRDARMRSFSATTFSFNAAQGGRCPKCKGIGTIDVDMQFLADVSMTCPECDGRRFRQDVLDVKYRGLSIADVLEMTVREAFTFFRTHRKLLKKLHFLTVVGLDYLPLGQPATTLSGGELQRLKLAVRLAGGSKSRTLFLIDEPTTGLHAADVARLLDCFAGLLSVGHSLIVIEHNLDVIKSADFVIDLGPEAGAAGGQLVASGTPEEVAAVPASITGRYLRSVGVVPVLDGESKFSEN